MAYDFDIDLTLRTATDGGPTMLKVTDIKVGAYDVLKGTATKNGGTASFDLQPEDVANVEFLAIEADNYANLDFAIDGGSAIDMDQPVMLCGAGAVGMLGATCLTMVVTNDDTEADANILVYVGRSGVYTPE